MEQTMPLPLTSGGVAVGSIAPYSHGQPLAMVLRMLST